MNIMIPETPKRILDTLRKNGYEAYAVGGCVRDSLLGLTPHDWDICTSALPEQIKACFADFKTLDIGIAHGTVAVIVDGCPFEVTTYRIDGDYKDNRHPDSVIFTRNLRDDLARRDFTVNALAYNETDGLIDAFGGVPIALTEKEAKVMREHFGGFQSAGSYNLNGEQALLYARTRKIDTDRDRTGRQRKILISLAAKARGFSTTDYMRLLDRILPLVSTDFTKSELLLQMASAVGYLGWNFEQHLIPAKPYKLVLRDNFEVILMNWPYEVDYLHEVMYEDVIPNYED